MTNAKQSSQFAVVSLILSLLGLGLLPLLFLSSPPILVFPWQTQLVGFVFMIICLLGIIAGVSPTHCSRSPRSKQKRSDTVLDLKTTQAGDVPIHKEGHHPTCVAYSSHIVQIRSHILCAGCTGLVTGALIALLGTVWFFFLHFRFVLPEVFFWIGWSFVAIGLLQHILYGLFHVKYGKIRVFINIMFVVGSFLLIANLWQLTNSLVFATYLLVLTLYWIFTRIIMSRRSHRHICTDCGKPGCPLSDT